MTVTNKQYIDEILEPIKDTHKIIHITLMAKKENLQKRLLKRGDRKSSWTYKMVDKCLLELSSDHFKDQIYTDDMSLFEVVDFIGKTYHLNLTEDNRNKIQKKLGQLSTTIKHLRIKEILFKI